MDRSRNYAHVTSRCETEHSSSTGTFRAIFNKFATYLKTHGHKVHKINFNGGDRYYCPTGVDYCGTPEGWRSYLRHFILQNDIGAIVVYGDCRFYHKEAVQLAEELHLKIMAFEEGYLRPDFITLEANGVNDHSEMNFSAMDQYPDHVEFSYTIGNSFAERTQFASCYYWASRKHQETFSNYRHHRVLNPIFEGSCWLRSFYRKGLYRWTQATEQQRLLDEFSGRYYLVPLQVFLDSQLLHHSPYGSISDFIQEVMMSFAKSAPKDTALIFKHHPEDRGHVNYHSFIQRLTAQHGLQDRVIYLHDLHLPTFLNKALGLITINSTVGISSLIHGTPVKTLGRSLIDRAGLASKLSLDDFWQKAEPVCAEKVRRFRNYLLVHGQVNASFYKKIDQGLPSIYRQFYRLLVEDTSTTPVPNQSLHGETVSAPINFDPSGVTS